MASATDDELIAAAVTRPIAFAAVFDRHYAAVWRYLCRRVGPTLADDLASETFVRALAGRAAYRASESGARPWLYGIATNVLRENARRERRHLQALGRVGRFAAPPDATEEIDARVDAESLGPMVAAALAGLAPGDRDVLLLFALTECDYEAIAVAVDVPVGTVRSRLHRARRQIRSELGTELSLERSER